MLKLIKDFPDEKYLYNEIIHFLTKLFLTVKFLDD